MRKLRTYQSVNVKRFLLKVTDLIVTIYIVEIEDTY